MNMQNAFRTGAAIAALSLPIVGLPTAAFAGGSLTATAPVSVTILAPVTLQTTQGLDFGAVTKPANANSNTVTLDASTSNVTLSGTGNATRAAGSVSAAKFSLIGDAGVTYSTTQSLNFAQPGLTNVSVSLPVAATGAFGVIPAAGVQELRFGGAFDVSAATPVQSSPGALSVTVNYN